MGLLEKVKARKEEKREKKPKGLLAKAMELKAKPSKQVEEAAEKTAAEPVAEPPEAVETEEVEVIEEVEVEEKEVSGAPPTEAAAYYKEKLAAAESMDLEFMRFEGKIKEEMKEAAAKAVAAGAEAITKEAEAALEERKSEVLRKLEEKIIKHREELQQAIEREKKRLLEALREFIHRTALADKICTAWMFLREGRSAEAAAAEADIPLETLADCHLVRKEEGRWVVVEAPEVEKLPTLEGIKSVLNKYSEDAGKKLEELGSTLEKELRRQVTTYSEELKEKVKTDMVAQRAELEGKMLERLHGFLDDMIVRVGKVLERDEESLRTKLELESKALEEKLKAEMEERLRQKEDELSRRYTEALEREKSAMDQRKNIELSNREAELRLGMEQELKRRLEELRKELDAELKRREAELAREYEAKLKIKEAEITQRVEELAKARAEELRAELEETLRRKEELVLKDMEVEQRKKLMERREELGEEFKKKEELLQKRLEVEKRMFEDNLRKELAAELERKLEVMESQFEAERAKREKALREQLEKERRERECELLERVEREVKHREEHIRKELEYEAKVKEDELRKKLEWEVKASCVVSERQPRPPYPLSALVGQELMKRALIFNAINPKIGGVLLWGQRETGKTTAVRGFAELFPPSEELKCELLCEYDNACWRCPKRFLTGTFSTDVFSADYTLDVIMNTCAVSITTAGEGNIVTPVAIIREMSPKMADIPQLLNRIPLHLKVDELEDLELRAEIVSRVHKFLEDPEKFREDYASQQVELVERVKRAHTHLPRVVLPDELRRPIVKVCRDFKAGGHGAEIMIEQLARASAAYEARPRVTVDDIIIAAHMVLPHRLGAIVEGKRLDMEQMAAIIRMESKG